MQLCVGLKNGLCTWLFAIEYRDSGNAFKSMVIVLRELEDIERGEISLRQWTSRCSWFGRTPETIVGFLDLSLVNLDIFLPCRAEYP
jgi:hypothetical protein